MAEIRVEPRRRTAPWLWILILVVIAAAGAYFASDVKLPGKIGCVDGEPVANGTRERGIIAVGARFFGEHASGRFKQPHFFDSRHRAQFRDLGGYAFAALLERDSRHDSL